MSIFDTDDEDDFAGKALFGGDEDDDDDLGDKFTLFDSEEEESLDLFGEEDDKDEE